MHRKGFSIIIGAILLITVSSIPATSFPNFLNENKTSVIENSRLPTDLSSFKNGDIKFLYSNIVDKICNDKDITSDLEDLYTHPEINEYLDTISTTETIEYIDLVFSKGNPFEKRIGAFRLAHKMNNPKDERVIDLKNYIESYFSEIKTINDLEGSAYLDRCGMDMDDVYQLKTDWEAHISQNKELKSLLDKTSIDNTDSFLILFVIITFILGGLSIILPEAMLYSIVAVEAILIGVLGSIVVGLLYTLESHPILDMLHNFINNSAILSKVPTIQSLLLSIIDLINGLMLSGNAILIALTGWIISNIFAGAFGLMFFGSSFFKFVSSGLFYISPFIIWYLIQLILSFFEPEPELLI